MGSDLLPDGMQRAGEPGFDSVDRLALFFFE
jgi:hypothetical protein